MTPRTGYAPVIVHRADWLSSMIGEFLDAPVPAAS
jgi:hypothetical protein